MHEDRESSEERADKKQRKHHVDLHVEIEKHDCSLSKETMRGIPQFPNLIEHKEGGKE